MDVIVLFGIWTVVRATTALGVLMMLSIGFLVLYGSIVERRKKSVTRDIPTSKVRSLAMGPVEVKGRVETYDEVLESPFSKDPCVMYTYAISRYVGEDNRDWKGVEYGKKAAKFYLNDGTGRVLVDPAGAEFDFSHRNVYTFRSDETDPRHISEFMERRDGEFDHHYDSMLRSSKEIYHDTSFRAGDANVSGELRKFTEEYLPAGAHEVYVFGEAMTRDRWVRLNGMKEEIPGDVEVIINIDEDTLLFKISDKPESEVISDTGSTSAWGLAIGLFFVLIGLPFAFIPAGIPGGIVLVLVSFVLAAGFNRAFTAKRT
ncbi:MAG: hypothetical protein SV377_01370 [Halobacteria archaeon]|nr:hypothetical protein [Halobacteria archaeon]